MASVLLSQAASPGKLMIRTTCAWVLLILAASPFTAPFSTCDLAALLGRAASVRVTSVGQAAQCVPDAHANTDATGICPVVSRTELTREPAQGASVPVDVDGERTGRGTFHVSGLVDQPPGAGLLKPSVLRL